ncbi:hypothetical protein RN001_014551 [Aquatica leii]|uniref:Uncharacterized protein n=1 Tax=Aquatica leii TaxID=1421715 RepID=A0AAN7SBH9_9COLE|nr:hypothetical protein RN001_014551 [Aquatica leii]
MAPTNTDVSGGSDKIICKLCHRSAITNIVRCINCDKVLHKYCCEKKGLNTSENTIKCCESDNAFVDSKTSETSMDDLNTNIKYMEQEIYFLKQQLQDKERTILDKIQIIKDKQEIIKLQQEIINKSKTDYVMPTISNLRNNNKLEIDKPTKPITKQIATSREVTTKQINSSSPISAQMSDTKLENNNLIELELPDVQYPSADNYMNKNHKKTAWTTVNKNQSKQKHDRKNIIVNVGVEKPNWASPLMSPLSVLDVDGVDVHEND